MKGQIQHAKTTRKNLPHFGYPVGRLTRPLSKASSVTGTILQVFLNTDLRNGHAGLKSLAAKNQINVDKLEPGQYVVFLNTARDKIKIYAANGVIAYKIQEKGRIYDLRVIAEIPRAFKGTGAIDMDSTLKRVLEETLRRKRQS